MTKSLKEFRKKIKPEVQEAAKAKADKIIANMSSSNHKTNKLFKANNLSTKKPRPL